MASKRKSTEKILDFLESSVPKMPEPPAPDRKAKTSVNEDMIPPPAADAKIAQGSNPRRPKPPVKEEGMDEPVKATEMAMKGSATSGLVDRLLRTGKAQGPKLA